MKKIMLCALAAGLLSACVSSTDPGTKIKIGEAIKREGDVFQSQGKYTSALAKLLEAEKMIPDDPYLQNSLGLAYMGKKRYDLAVIAFKKSLALKPDYTEAVNNLGAAYLRQEKWDTAITLFNQVLENLIYPTPHYPLANIGWAYLGKLHFPTAQTYFLKALDEKPEFSTATHGLAQVYLRTGQTDRAIKYLHERLSRTPGSAILHADLAQAYEKKDQRKQAIRAWKQVLKLSSKNSSLAKKADKRLTELQ